MKHELISGTRIFQLYIRLFDINPMGSKTEDIMAQILHFPVTFLIKFTNALILTL